MSRSEHNHTRPWWVPAPRVAAVVGIEFAVAYSLASRPSLAMAAVAIISTATLLIWPGSLIALAPTSCFIATRVGGGSLDLSVTDAFLVIATFLALRRFSATRKLQSVFIVSAVYLLMLSLCVAANPTRAGVLEWLHRSATLVGALVVGNAVVASGRTKLALRSLLVAASIFAVVAIGDTLASGLSPAYPLGFHKNFAGPLMAMSALVALVAKREAELRSPLHLIVFTLLLMGVAATQSRASLLGLAVCLVVNGLRARRHRLATKVVAVTAAAATATFAIRSLIAATTGANDTRFNSVRSREAVYQVAFNLFREHPIFGAGLRWFKLSGPSQTAYFEPHSAFFATISESGAWGLIAVIILFGGAIIALWRTRSPLAQAAVLLLLFRLVEGQVAIFWVAGTMTLPWLVVGMATVASAAEQSREPWQTVRYAGAPRREKFVLPLHG